MIFHFSQGFLIIIVIININKNNIITLGDPLFPMFYHRTVWGQNGPEVVLKNLTEDIFPFFHSQVLTTKSPHRTIVKVHLEPVLCTSSPVAGHQEDATTGDFDDDDDDINN